MLREKVVLSFGSNECPHLDIHVAGLGEYACSESRARSI